MILVECNPDEALVNFLGIKREEIIHENGKSGICKKLKSKENIKGLVDEDPLSPQPKYIEGLLVELKSKSQKLETLEKFINYDKK
ncbi:MAG TPA: hypothetical protein PKW23_06400 [Dictyoglomaceae bacterium]|nr:hypothetical protein [Dictyoglomaceae bacterium]HOL39853.1 hypothetical protein [Dictyoglomaceae bacterium]HPP16352.1 hypothetical protein [Dictyoglomaceae bacterium]HPU43421.1 hypothetical protein [Dictyoglomaceae bacterium]